MSQPRATDLSASFPFAADAADAERIAFIKKTYAHLAGAIAVFVALEAFLFSLPRVQELVMGLASGKGGLLFFGLFMVVAYVSEKWANSTTAVSTQYLGLSLYVVFEALFFLPLLWIVERTGGPTVVPTAAILTLLLFGGLSAAVFVTGKDLSFLGGGLTIVGFGAMGLMICSMLFGFNLGNVFCAGMLVLASGYVLYDTSNVIHRYRVGQHVAASLALFASIALMFWYVLRLVNSFSRR